MHSNNLAIAVKVGGKVCREFGDTVYVPFASEFSIYLKNMNSRRASVKVSIDGEDVLNGTELIINANSSLELERYLKDLDKGNRFKFIARTSNIEKHRGIGAEDGLVRIEFAYERIPVWNNGGYNPWNYPPGVRGYDWYDKTLIGSPKLSNPNQPNWGGALRSTLSTNSVSTQSSFTDAVGAAGCKATTQTFNRMVGDVGITVPGSESNQKFTQVSGFLTDASTVMVIKLVGEMGQNLVKQAVTVKAKPTCVTCGRVNKATNKFCSECGTALIIV